MANLETAGRSRDHVGARDLMAASFLLGAQDAEVLEASATPPPSARSRRARRRRRRRPQRSACRARKKPPAAFCPARRRHGNFQPVALAFFDRADAAERRTSLRGGVRTVAAPTRWRGCATGGCRGAATSSAARPTSALKPISVADYTAWFVDAVRAVLAALEPSAVALFYVTDGRRSGPDETYLDKSHLCHRGAEAAGAACLFHRIVLGGPAGVSARLSRAPSYAHLLAFSVALRPPRDALVWSDVVPTRGHLGVHGRDRRARVRRGD